MTRTRHPHFGHTRSGHAVHLRAVDHLPVHSAYARLNKRVAVAVTRFVGSMTCAWLFCGLALCSLPAVLSAFSPFAHAFPAWMVKASIVAFVAWIAQTFLQLVLLSIIIVGQNIQAEASDARAAKTFEDTEMIVDRLDVSTQGGITEILDEVKRQRDDLAALAEAVRGALAAHREALTAAVAVPQRLLEDLAKAPRKPPGSTGTGKGG